MATALMPIQQITKGSAKNYKVAPRSRIVCPPMMGAPAGLHGDDATRLPYKRSFARIVRCVIATPSSKAEEQQVRPGLEDPAGTGP